MTLLLQDHTDSDNFWGKLEETRRQNSKRHTYAGGIKVNQSRYRPGVAQRVPGS